MKEKKVSNRVLVVGGGIQGLEVSKALASKGLDVLLAEKSKDLGGFYGQEKLEAFSFKPGGAYLSNLLKEVESEPRIQVLKGTCLVDVEGYLGNYQVSLQQKTITKHEVSAIVLALDFETVTVFPETGKNIISFTRFKELLNPAATVKNEIITLGGSAPKSVTFLMTGETSSRYMFSLILNYAMFLKEKLALELWIVIPQALVAGDNLEPIYRKAREKGIVFIKYENPPAVKLVEHRVELQFNDAYLEELTISSEALVVSEKIIPQGYLQELKEKLNLKNFKNMNFLTAATTRKGIFQAGIVGVDLLPQEMKEEALGIAGEINRLIGNRQISFEENVIEINETKCTLCLTCYRVCPHSAIEVRKDILERRAVKIIEEACFHCGTCVGECPAKALSYQDRLVSTGGLK